MRFKFECHHVIPGCKETLDAETKDELMAEVERHARQDHGIETLEPATVEMVRAGIVARDD